MATHGKSANSALQRGRVAAVDLGKVAKSAAIVAARAGASAAIVAGTAEVARGLEAMREKPPLTKRGKIAAVMAGVATLAVAGLAVARVRSKRTAAAAPRRRRTD